MHPLDRHAQNHEFYIHGHGTTDSIVFTDLGAGEKIYLKNFRLEELPANGAIDISGNKRVLDQYNTAEAALLSEGAPY